MHVKGSNQNIRVIWLLWMTRFMVTVVMKQCFFICFLSMHERNRCTFFNGSSGLNLFWLWILSWSGVGTVCGDSLRRHTLLPCGSAPANRVWSCMTIKREVSRGGGGLRVSTRLCVPSLVASLEVFVSFEAAAERISWGVDGKFGGKFCFNKQIIQSLIANRYFFVLPVFTEACWTFVFVLPP